MAHAGTTTRVAFPFADMSLSSTAVRESDLGCAVNIRGDVAAPLFFLNVTGAGDAAAGGGGGGAAPAGLVDRDVPHESLNKVVELSSKVSKLNEVLGISGELSVHFGNIGGSGHGSFANTATTDRNTFNVLQKVTKTVSHTSINTNLLAQAVSRDNAQVLHPQLQAGPAEAQAFVDEQGAEFVSSVTKGGVLFRRITYSCANAQQAQRVKAGLAGSVNLGYQVDFEAEFEQLNEEENAEIQISIEVKAAGGDTDLLGFTHTIQESNAQLEAWQASVTVANSVVVAAEFKDVGKAYIPVLQWNDHQIAAFNRNVKLAKSEYWKLAVLQVGWLVGWYTPASKQPSKEGCCVTTHPPTPFRSLKLCEAVCVLVMTAASVSIAYPFLVLPRCLPHNLTLCSVHARMRRACSPTCFRLRSTNACSEPGLC